MNEQAFEDLYNLFVGSGYKKSKEDFVLLMNENGDAYNDAFELFKNAGYQKGEDEFATLIGIGNPLKKKRRNITAKRRNSTAKRSKRFYGFVFGRWFFGFSRIS